MEMYEWINYYKPYHLTIGDLKKWNPGEIKDVVIFDRNFDDYFIWDELKENKLYTPSYFFKENRHKIRYNGDLTWDIIFHWGDTFCHNVELDIAEKQPVREIFGTDCVWKPLNGEYMIIKTNQKNSIHWTDFNDETRIGWRGPIMLWKDVKKGEKVYFNKTALLD